MNQSTNRNWTTSMDDKPRIWGSCPWSSVTKCEEGASACGRPTLAIMVLCEGRTVSWRTRWQNLINNWLKFLNTPSNRHSFRWFMLVTVNDLLWGWATRFGPICCGIRASEPLKNRGLGMIGLAVNIRVTWRVWRLSMLHAWGWLICVDSLPSGKLTWK